MPANRGRSGSTSGRRQTRWIRSPTPGNSIAAATPEVGTLLTASAQDVGSTILRIVGNVSFAGRTVDTDSIYWFGILVAPSTMDAADMDPAVTTNLDWMYYQPRGWRQAAYDGVDSFVNQWFDLDLRGRRKLTEGDALFYIENATGQTMVSFVNLSVLVLMP